MQERSGLESVEIVRLPCAGKIEIGLVLKCFEQDAAGVLILACPIDNCQYLTGNKRARKRVEMIKQALRDAGYDENRVKLDFLSSLDPHKFVKSVKEMKENVKEVDK